MCLYSKAVLYLLKCYVQRLTLLTMAQAEKSSWNLRINIKMVSYINYLKIFTTEPIIDIDLYTV